MRCRNSESPMGNKLVCRKVVIRFLSLWTMSLPDEVLLNIFHQLEQHQERGCSTGFFGILPNKVCKTHIDGRPDSIDHDEVFSWKTTSDKVCLYIVDFNLAFMGYHMLSSIRYISLNQWSRSITYKATLGAVNFGCCKPK